MILRKRHPFIIGQKWDAFFGTHVGKNDARRFSARVGRVVNLVFERAAGRLRRSFQNSARHVVFPAVVDAPQAALFVAAIKQRRTSVRTMLSQEPDAALAIAEGDEIFSE